MPRKACLQQLMSKECWLERLYSPADVSMRSMASEANMYYTKWCRGRERIECEEVLCGRGRKVGLGHPRRGQDGKGGLHHILTPILGLKVIHWATWSCSSNLAGADLISPLEQTGNLNEVREQMITPRIPLA